MRLLRTLKIAGTIALGLGIGYLGYREIQDTKKPLTEQKQKTEQRRKESPDPLKVFEGYENENEQDPIIRDRTRFWNKKYERYKDLPGYERLDPNLSKAVSLKETGNDEDRQHDPLQVANSGDSLKRGKKLTNGRWDNIHPTPHKNGEWCHEDVPEEHRINPEASYDIGIAHLWDKNAIEEWRIIGDGRIIDTYTVKKDDTLGEIADNYEVWWEAIRNENNVNPESLQIGQKLRIPNKRRKLRVVGFKGWKEAVRDYNGGGNPKYMEELKELYKFN